jgi:GT2 family glycosyltransferase
MIAFGTAVTKLEEYQRVALPAIGRAAEGDSVILRRDGLSLQTAYNEMLDEAAAIPGIEALVLLHQDAEICDPDFVGKIRRRLASDERIAMIGPVGARAVRTLAQTAGESFGRARVEILGVERWLYTAHPWGAHEVDSLDGFLMVLSPWAIRELRFDLRFERDFHGYDVDICFEARRRGATVVVDELDAVHRHDGQFMTPGRPWARTAVRWKKKWKHRLPPPPAG